MFDFFVFIFGLVVGSFLNAAIYRLRPVSKNTKLSGRSACPNCRHTLSWYDLIPLASFLILRGRCRYCRKSISWQYPIVELTTGIVWFILWQFLLFDWPVKLLYLILAADLVFIFVYDLKYYLILDKVIYLGLIAALVIVLGQTTTLGADYLFRAGAGSLISGGLFFLLVTVSKEKWMGRGDIALGFLLGLVAPWPLVWLFLTLAFCLGAVVGVILLIFGKKKLSSQIPFAPFLITASLITIVFGERLVGIYLRW